MATAASIIGEVGYLTTTDEDGDLAFKIEGVRGYFQTAEGDDNFARIWIRFGLEPEIDIDKAIRIANRLTSTTKAVKLTINPTTRHFTVSVECLFEDIEHLRAPMERIFHALVSADADFYAQLLQPESSMETNVTA